MSEKPGRYQRSFAGMIGAMVIVLLVIGAFVAFRDANRVDPESPVKAVDYVHPAEFAQEKATFTVLDPDSLPEGWIATSARFTEGPEEAWHLGVLTDARKYIGVEQAKRTVTGMVEEFVDDRDAVRGEDVTINGQAWQSWTDSGDDTALVLKQPDVTTLVVGTVGLEALTDYVASLR